MASADELELAAYRLLGTTSDLLALIVGAKRAYEFDVDNAVPAELSSLWTKELQEIYDNLITGSLVTV